MSTFTCAHGEPYELFGRGGGEQLAADIGVPLMARIPLEPAVSLGGDQGEPVALAPATPAGRAFYELVDAVVATCPPVAMGSCSARLATAFQALEVATPAVPYP
jgi:ATP-binding protein involved in chromosome partitioning